MQIILTPEENTRRELEIKNLKEQNMTCPLCGENKDLYFYLGTSDFLKRGIEEIDFKIKNYSFLKKRKTKIDYMCYYKYKCYTCKAQWIGDPIPHYCDI